LSVEDYIEGAVSLVRDYKECEKLFYSFMSASVISFFLGCFIYHSSRYLGAWTMAMSSFMFMISAVCWGVIKIIITIRLYIVGDKIGTNGV